MPATNIFPKTVLLKAVITKIMEKKGKLYGHNFSFIFKATKNPSISRQKHPIAPDQRMAPNFSSKTKCPYYNYA